MIFKLYIQYLFQLVHIYKYFLKWYFYCQIEHFFLSGNKCRWIERCVVFLYVCLYRFLNKSHTHTHTRSTNKKKKSQNCSYIPLRLRALFTHRQQRLILEWCYCAIWNRKEELRTMWEKLLKSTAPTRATTHRWKTKITLNHTFCTFCLLCFCLENMVVPINPTVWRRYRRQKMWRCFARFCATPLSVIKRVRARILERHSPPVIQCMMANQQKPPSPIHTHTLTHIKCVTGCTLSTKKKKEEVNVK